MNKHFLGLPVLMLAGLMAAGAVVAQTSGGQVTSFGKRPPSLDELKRALDPETEPKSELQTMSIRVEPATRVEPVKKAIDMELVFPFGSAEISPRVKGQLGTLGQYLQNAKLGPGEFRIEGHSDGVGSAEFNRGLSERRARAVKDFLVGEYKVDKDGLSTSGWGATQLKDPRNPASEVNRRVEFSRTLK